MKQVAICFLNGLTIGMLLSFFLMSIIPHGVIFSIMCGILGMMGNISTKSAIGDFRTKYRPG